MSFELSTIPPVTCPSDEISAYIDGELTPVHELELDGHFGECRVCSEELNQQKQFLRHLDVSLKHESELALPANFTKHIVANAESTVSGLRRPRERFNAIFICAGLALFGLFAMGAEAGNLFGRLSVVVEKAAAVADILGHAVYSFFIGMAVVVRSFAFQFQLGLAAGVAIMIVFVIISLFFSRKVLSARRA